MKPCMGVRASEREKKILFKRKEDSFLFLMQLLDKTLRPRVSAACMVGCTFLSVKLKFKRPNLGLVHAHSLAQFIGAIGICVQGFFVIQACKCASGSHLGTTALRRCITNSISCMGSIAQVPRALTPRNDQKKWTRPQTHSEPTVRNGFYCSRSRCFQVLFWRFLGNGL